MLFITLILLVNLALALFLYRALDRSSRASTLAALGAMIGSYAVFSISCTLVYLSTNSLHTGALGVVNLIIATIFILLCRYRPANSLSTSSERNHHTVDFVAGLLVFAGYFFATAPDLLPTWANVDFGQHYGMIEAITEKMSLQGNQRQIHLEDFLADYPYLFGFHLAAAVLAQITQISALYCMHFLISLLLGILAFLVSLMLERFTSIAKILVVTCLFLSPEISAFVLRGWCPHLFGTVILVASAYLATKWESESNVPMGLQVGLEALLGYLCFTSYPFCLPVYVIYLIMVKLAYSKAPLRSIMTSLIAVGVAVIPCLLLPSNRHNALAIVSRFFGLKPVEVYHALSVSEAAPVITTGRGLVLLASLLICWLLRRQIYFFLAAAWLIVLALMMMFLPLGAYLLEKAWHSFFPVSTVILCGALILSLEKISQRTEGIRWLRTFSYGLASLIIILITRPEFHTTDKIRRAFLSAKDLDHALRLKALPCPTVVFIGVDGAKEFLIRHLINCDIWSGPYYRPNYHISGPVNASYYGQKLFEAQVGNTWIWNEGPVIKSDAKGWSFIVNGE